MRLPSTKDKFSSLGTAIHSALSSQFGSKAELLVNFKNNLKKEFLSDQDFGESLLRGNQALSGYYDFYQPAASHKDLIDYDFKTHHIFINSIPITGKIDKINLLDSTIDGHKCVEVVDFKTGNPDSKSVELSTSGEYFRQLVFYKLLADNDHNFPYKVTHGCIDFIQPSSRSKKYVRKNFEFTIQDVDQLSILIAEVFQNICSLKFPISPDCPDRDDLHRLAK